MNIEEAKLILQCRRPGGRDDHDPAVSEALAIVREDAEAAESLRGEETLDAAIGERLRSVEPPADLLRKILVGGKVTKPKRWWQRAAWLAVAAVFAVCAPLAVRNWPGNTTGFAAITLADFRTAT